MYVSVNKEAMTLHHKHKEAGVVALLAAMELCDVRYSVFPVEVESLRLFTDLELRLLHNNVTGRAMQPLPLHRISEEVVAAIGEIPETDAVLYEARLQWVKIPVTSKERYRYVPGGFQAELGGDLFECKPINHSTKEPVRVKRFGPAPAPEIKTPVKPTATPLQPPKAPHLLPTWHPLYKPA